MIQNIQAFQAFAISLGVGLLIGLERERSHPIGRQAIGVRSFMLFSVLGTLTAYMGQLPLTLTLSVFVFGAILLGYLRSTRQRLKFPDIGITTEISAAIVYCLGYVAFSAPFLAAVLGGVVLLILVERKRLHTFSRNKLKPREIEAAIILLLFALGVLPLLPNYAIDPWEIFNPRRYGILVIMIAAIQFGGYVAIRVFGSRLGTVLMGFFGGLVSSTAVLASLPRIVRQQPELTYAASAAAILSAIGMLIELSLVLFVASPQLLLLFIRPILAMMIMGGLAALYILKGKTLEVPVMNHPMNPLDFAAILRLSFLIGGMIFLVALAKHSLGVHGIEIVAFFGGFFELHSVSLAIATLFQDAKLAVSDARLGIALAILATFCSKFALLWSLARNQFAVITTIALTLMLIAGVIMYLLV